MSQHKKYSFKVNQEVYIMPSNKNGLVEMRRQKATNIGIVNLYLISFDKARCAGWFHEREIEPKGQLPLAL